VIEIENDNEKLLWVGNSSTEFLNISGKTYVNTAVRLADLFDANAQMRGALVKAYIWNKTRSDGIISSADIKVRRGNKMIYGLFQEF
ncbi:MAG: hypothetical protein MRY83_01425, partial [Flavobacteriales bacterium]|nr:hypothetical protein [Flavobacteriales bacterium]